MIRRFLQSKCTQLESKMHVATMGESEIGFLSLLIPAGPRYEDANSLGAAHHLKNFAFMDTESHSRTKIAWESLLCGAKLGCHLTRNFVVYSAVFQNQDLKFVVESMAAVVNSTKFTPWDLQEVQKKCLEESNMVRQNPTARALDLAFKAAFHGGLGNSLYCGEIPLSLESLQSFHSNHSKVNENAAITALGVPHDKLLSLTNNFFTGEVKNKSKRYVGGEIREQSAVGNCCILAFPSESSAVLDTVCKLICPTSPIRTKKSSILQSDPARIRAFDADGLFVLESSSHFLNPNLAAAAAKEMLDKLLAFKFSEEDIERAAKQAKLSHYQTLDNSLQHSFYLGSCLASNIPQKDFNVSKKQVQDFIEKLPKPTFSCVGNDLPLLSDLIN